MKKILILLVAVLATVGFSAGAYNCPDNLYFYVSNATSSSAFTKSTVNGTTTFTYTVDATGGDVYGVIVNSDVTKWDEAHASDAYFPNGYNPSNNYEVSGATTWNSITQWDKNNWSNGCYKFVSGQKYDITINYSNGNLYGSVSVVIPSTLYVGVNDNGTWNYVAMTAVAGEANTFSYSGEITKGTNLLYRFGVTEDMAKKWSSNVQVFAPSEDQQVSTGGEVTSNSGDKCWKATAPENGTYLIKAKYLAPDKLQYSVTFTQASTTKTLYMAYSNQTGVSYRIVEATSTTEATEVINNTQVTVTKYNFVVPIYNTENLRWKFVTNKSASLTTANAELFAPEEDRIPYNVKVDAGKGASYWRFTPNYDGTATVSAWFTKEDQTQINLSYTATYYERPRKGNFFYSTDDGATWIMVPNRITVEGEYTQWNVTITGNKGMEVKFFMYDDQNNAEYYKVAGDNYLLGDKNNHLFTDFNTTNDQNFKFDGSYTYQFLIRKFDDHKNENDQTIVYPYEIAARKVSKDSNFTEYAFKDGLHPDNYTMKPVSVDLSQLHAASPFKADMAYDESTGNMKLTPGVEGNYTTEIHWVKYEHPYWGARSAATMQYKDANHPVDFALWWSDTYLHPNDPRVKAWFPDKADQLGRRNSIDKINDPSFKPQTSSAVPTYYRAYITMKRVIVDPVQPTNGPQRAVVNSQFAGNYGTRVAFAAPLPTDATPDIVSGVEEVSVEPAAEFDGEPEYYTISGIRVYGTPAPGLYIVRRGNVVTKEILK